MKNIANQSSSTEAKDLANWLTRFVASPLAKHLAGRYHVRPDESLGYLYLRMAPRMATASVRNREAWLCATAQGYLRHYLAREHVIKP